MTNDEPIEELTTASDRLLRDSYGFVSGTHHSGQLKSTGAITDDTSDDSRPRLAITMGDVAGIGPEVIARVCAQELLWQWCRPIVVGHSEILERALRLVGGVATVVPLMDLSSLESHEQAGSVREIPCWNPTNDEVLQVEPGGIDARAGAAAYQYLVGATRSALTGMVDAIATAPLNKAALHLAGHSYPGHTEILAEACGIDEFGMMLYLPPGQELQPQYGLGVVHATLHTSIRSVPDLLSTAVIEEKVHLVARFMQDVGCSHPRVGVCALNPHAGENQLFGDEEPRIISPAVAAAQAAGVSVTGPLPADTLLRRAVLGEFDAIVAMYHDQGHIALKLVGCDRAVNVTLGLPIIRSSPSHGTAFDIAWKGLANADGMLEAIRIATLLANLK